MSKSSFINNYGSFNYLPTVEEINELLDKGLEVNEVLKLIINTSTKSYNYETS